MKGRAHPLPTTDPPDDWGDGSWTVDCSCGVTYDDGEEMVSCDECGVWVHTRCSRFSKGDSSFSCHKCTAPSSSSAHGIGGDAEETEVARLLAELPTKAGYSCFPNPSPPRRPFRLWAETPLEDRVHVQGVPGGDPALFRGLSSVFTSELWKCTGYVPKKFNFQYKEFPCWDEKEGDEEEEDENPANRGAGVLFSLSKEILPRVPSARTFDWRSSSEGVRKREGIRALGGGSRSQSNGKKERNNRFRVLGGHSGKRKKEERGEGKDRSSKKKARSIAHKTVEANNKRGSVGRVNKSDMFEDASLQVAESNLEDQRTEDRKNGLSEPNSCDQPVEEDKVGKNPGNTIVVNAQRGSFSDQELKQNSSEAPVKVGRAEQLDNVKIENATDDDAFIAAGGQGNEPVKVLVKEEDVSNVVHGLKQLKHGNHQEGVVRGSENSNHVDTIPWNNHPGILDSTRPPDTNGTILLGSKMYEIEVRSEFRGEQITENAEFQSHPTTNGILADAHQVLQKPHSSMCCSTENPQQHETISCLQPDEHRSHEEVSLSCIGSDEKTCRMVSKSSKCKQHEQVVDESAGLVVAPEGSIEGKFDSVNALETLKSGDPDISRSACNACILDNGGRIVSPIQVTSRCDSAGPTSSLEGTHDSIACDSSKSAGPYTGQLASSGHKGLGKIPSSAQVSSRSVSRKSDLGKSESPGIAVSLTAMKAVHSSKPHRVKVNTSSVGKKEDVTIGVSPEESTRVISKHPTKENSRGPTYSESILSQPSKISYASSSSKHDLSDSKEKHAGSSSRASNRENMEILSELNGQGASSVQIKVKSSTCQKNEKNNQPFSQPSSKIFNNSIGMRLSTSVNTLNAGLSDEELALLLHQQLNSSPRVPRVPRVRQATSMQLTSPTGTSTLSKRSSFSGGKDHVVVSRRKIKEDPSRDGSRNFRELGGETKGLGRYPPSPDKKHQDSSLMTVGSFKNDARSRSPDSATSGRKNTPIASTAGSNSTHSSSLDANGQNVLATRSLTKDISDDDGVSARTLPGLVDEIMKKGRCTTYEELCDAVHPHWHSLRKPNGERYAYSSHSQAVLDCLRNRNEWSHLIDRGPKTNSSKKRRKIDSDTSYMESESEDAKNKDTKEEEDDKNGDSHREDFPKGKRKARKRRHLGPQGRSSKDRKRYKQDLIENDLVAHSHSSNEDGDSDVDESQEARPHAVGTEVSASSSDETD